MLQQLSMWCFVFTFFFVRFLHTLFWVRYAGKTWKTSWLSTVAMFIHPPTASWWKATISHLLRLLTVSLGNRKLWRKRGWVKASFKHYLLIIITSQVESLSSPAFTWLDRRHTDVLCFSEHLKSITYILLLTVWCNISMQQIADTSDVWEMWILTVCCKILSHRDAVVCFLLPSVSERDQFILNAQASTALFDVSTEGKSYGFLNTCVVLIISATDGVFGSLFVVHTVTWTLFAGVLQGDFFVHPWNFHKFLWPQVDGHTNPH